MISKKKSTFNVLIIADFCATFPGSFIKSIEELSKKIIIKGGKIYYIFPRKMEYMNKLEEFGEVIIIQSFRGKKIDIFLCVKLHELVKKYKIDIIHTHFGLSAPISASFISGITKAIHIWHERNPSRFFLKDENKKRKYLVQLFFKFINIFGKNYYIAISNEVKSSLLNYNGFPVSKISVINNAVDIKDILIKRNQNVICEKVTEKREFEKYKNIVGMVAHFGPQKDHETIIKAARLVIAKEPNCLFVLVGGNIVGSKIDYVAKSKKLTEELNIKSNFYFLGKVPNPVPIINLFDIGVLVSNWEGFGNVIVEYMVNKKPVVATNTGGIKDIILNGITGFLCPPKDDRILANKIMYLIQNKNKAKEMGGFGYERALEKFNMDKWTKKIISIYQDALISHKSY